MFEKQVSALPRFERCGKLRVDEFLREAVIDAIVFALRAALDAHQNMRAVRGYCGNRAGAGKEQDAVGAGVGDVGKFFQIRAREMGAKIAGEFVFDPLSDFLETQGAQFGDHASGLERRGELFRGGGQELRRVGPDLLQRLPAFCARGVAGGVTAMPPDDEEIRVERPVGLLRAVTGFERIEDFRDVHLFAYLGTTATASTAKPASMEARPSKGMSAICAVAGRSLRTMAATGRVSG